MSHDSCVTMRNKLTAQEEANFAGWFVRSVRERSEQFTFRTDHVVASLRGISVYVGNGPQNVRVISPEASAVFSYEYGKMIFDAAHEVRHAGGSDYSRMIAKAIAEEEAAGKTAGVLPNPEARTEPQVAKLRELVKVKAPALVAVAVVLAFSAVAAFAG